MKPKNPEEYRKFQTFPSKGGAPKGPQFAPGANKFQQMATFHKQQEQTGDYRNAPQHRKIHFGGTPKMQYREGGKFYKPPPPQDSSGKSGGKVGGANGKNKKFQKPEVDETTPRGKKKKVLKKKKKEKKGDPVKGTSTEYAQLANSDDEDDVMDVSDMLEKDEDVEEEEDVKDSEIPLINTAKKLGGLQVKPKVRKFNALGEYEDVKQETDEEVEEPKPKKRKTSDSEDSDSDGPPHEEKEDSEDGDDDDEEDRLKFREEISQMPLGKVREMKEKLGIKLFNKTYFGTSEVDKKRQEERKKEKSDAEKGGQHRPKEISSKRPVSTFRNIYGDHEKGTKKKKWDPRFDSRAGDFKEVCFENNYQFLDEIRSGEMQDLRNEYKTARGEGDEKKAERLKNTLHKMETREKTRAEKRRQAETRKELHDDNIERMLRGEAPVFRTKAQVRRIDAEKKYEELKKDNKLDKYLQRKAKKESAKQKKARPFEGYGYDN